MSMIGCTTLRLYRGRLSFCCPSVETDVLEIQGLIVDAAQRWRNPVGKFSRLGYAAGHEGLHEGIVFRAGQPIEFVLLPRLFVQNFTVDTNRVAGEVSNCAMKAFVR